MTHYTYANGKAVTASSAYHTASYIYAGDDTVGAYHGSTWYDYFTDQQGSTMGIMKQDGSTAAAYTYSDFGDTEDRYGALFQNEVCYTGSIYDRETGEYYLNARYYDPASANFLSQDTYRGEDDDYAQWNLYAYCANDPVNNIDLSGHAKKKAIAGFGVQLAFTKGTIGALVIAYDLIWYRDKNIEKYDDGALHVYRSIGGTGSSNKEATILERIAKHPRYMMKANKAKKLVKGFKGKWAVSAGFFVLLKKGDFKHYKDYEGRFLGLSVSSDTIYVAGELQIRVSASGLDIPLQLVFL